MCDDRLLNKATEMAKLSTFKQRVGCIIVDKRGKIISTGHNLTKTHPIQKRYAKQTAKKEGDDKRIYLHAEVAALVKAKGIGHTIYISRVKKNGETGLAKPCPICQMAIKEAGIENIFYTK